MNVELSTCPFDFISDWPLCVEYAPSERPGYPKTDNIDKPHTKPRTERVNITVPEMTLKQIDAEARKRGMSKSSFLAHLAQNKIHSDNSQQSA
jgi:hypothetical protein